MKKILFAPAAMLALAMAVPAHAGLIINATFDPDLTVAEQTSINQAIATYESLFSNNITVSIYFQGVNSGLGASQYFVYKESYTSFYTGLLTNDANPTALADLTANGGSGSNNPVTGNGFIELKSADSRAIDPTGSLGLSESPLCQLTGGSGNESCNGSSGPAYDGLISLNTGLTNPPGSSGSNYSLLAVSEHEIDEVLGLGSALENCNGCQGGAVNGTNDTINPCAQNTPPTVCDWNAPAPEDLWRFAADGTTRSFSTNCASPTAAYFFLNAATQIAQFNNACNGGDFGDWQSNPLPNGVNPQVQDAFGTPGSTPTLGTSEIDALTAIGYTLSAPEPSTWVLLLSSLVVLALVKRRRTRIA